MRLEDMIIGAEQMVGTHIFDENAMIAFAKIYDPRDYYIDKQAAKNGPFGRLVASGWYLTAIWMQMMMNQRQANFWQKMAAKADPKSEPAQPKAEPAQPNERPPRMGPSPGFLGLTWPHPVCAGDEIAYNVRVHKIIKLKSRPEWGIVRNLNIGRNQKGEIVMQFFGQVLMERRHVGGI